MSAYSHFAKYYDELTENVGYAKRADFFHSILSGYMELPSILLDLACGTGSLSLEFAALGYEVIGVDRSAAMLSKAMEKSAAAGRDVLFLRQNAARLDLYGTVDACVCALDSINHFSGEAQLRRAFCRVSLFTRPGGLFLFDVNTPYKHREVLGDRCFVYDLDKVYCVWQNQYRRENDAVDISLDFFEPMGDGKYQRTQESFSERIFSGEFLLEALGDSGFELLAVYGDDIFAPQGPETQRLIYVARKAG